MFFKKQKEKESKYTEGFNAAYYSHSNSKNPYNYLKEEKEHREWFTGYTDGINATNIMMNKSIFNYSNPKCSG